MAARLTVTDDYREVAQLLRQAADLWDRALDAPALDDRLAAAGSAAWRAADAGLRMRAMLERENITGIGITEPTGRGAELPRRIK